ncbi:MAG TPA: dienelactone hydrolase family protein [Acidimicrobiales bacterium]
MSATTPLTIHEPAGDPKGGVIVIQEAFGVNDHIDDVTKRFAKEGWLAVAPHLFHRSGDPTFAYDDMAGIRTVFEQLKADEILEDVDAAIAHLEGAGIPRSRIGIVGFCMGGSVALVTAARRDLGAAVTFYGGGVSEGRFGFPPLVDEAPRLRAPWLGLYGDLDTGIPVEDVERLRAAAASSSVETELVRYPEAGHGFHCDQRDAYHAESAKDAWRRTLDWFERHLRS